MYIYKTTNLINNKIYLGLDRQNSYTNRAKNYLGSGILIKKAIKKYGKQNFKKEIIEDNITDFQILCEREIFWIAFYNSTDLKIGYNILKGGYQRSDYKPTEETKLKIGNASKTRIYSKERGKKISIALKGKNLSEQHKEKVRQANLGKTHTQKTKQKMSKSHKNKIKTKKHRKNLSKSLSGRKLSESHKESIRRTWRLGKRLVKIS